MKFHKLLLVSLCLLCMAPALAGGPSSNSDPVLQSLEMAHDDNERMHERWLPEVNWQRQREKVVDMLCEMGGVIALALVDCGWTMAELVAPEEKPMVLEPVNANDRTRGVRELLQRPPEARMRSI